MNFLLEHGTGLDGPLVSCATYRRKCSHPPKSSHLSSPTSSQPPHRQGGRMADWCNLHSDMLMLIARCVKEVRDHLAFAAVCSSWRLVALEVRPTFPRPVPGLMLSGSQSQLFFSLSQRICYEDKINLLDDGDACLGSHGGWLFIMHKNFDISLFNPYSRERLFLPPMTSFPNLGEGQFKLDYNYYVGAAALSSQNINMTPKDVTVMVVEGAFRRLAFSKPGDSSWCVIDDDPGQHYTSILFYRGQFYAVGEDTTVVCDIGLNPKATSVAPLPPELLFVDKRYLVELMGELVLVERLSDSFNEDPYNRPVVNQVDEFDNYDRDDINFDVEEICASTAVDRVNRYRTMLFLVYKMDFANSQWVPINDLKDHVIFVGYNTAFSMPVWDSHEGNCIFFTDDNEYAYVLENRRIQNYGYDMGIFDVKNRIIKHHVGHRKRLFPPPMWINYLPW